MKLGTTRLVPFRGTMMTVLAGLALAGCMAGPDIDRTSVAPAAAVTPNQAARAAAVQDMRIQAEAAEAGAYPDVFSPAAPEEGLPRPMSEVAAIESDAARTARQRRASPADVAAGQARTAELRRLAQTHAQTAEQAITASGSQ